MSQASIQEQAENVSSTLQSHLRVSLNDNVRGNLPTGQNLGVAPDHRLRLVGKGTMPGLIYYTGSLKGELKTGNMGKRCVIDILDGDKLYVYITCYVYVYGDNIYVYF